MSDMERTGINFDEPIEYGTKGSQRITHSSGEQIINQDFIYQVLMETTADLGGLARTIVLVSSTYVLYMKVIIVLCFLTITCLAWAGEAPTCKCTDKVTSIVTKLKRSLCQGNQKGEVRQTWACENKEEWIKYFKDLKPTGNNTH
ncbi:hypothetical protein JTB14_001337 [Gonioctena quinquepunctata]|nr:hypothetical protein JTB14_001337 [Gonioctena quinquepunctata]